MTYFELMHNAGLHAWDLPALAVLVLIVVMGLVHKRNQNKREKDFEQELAAAGIQADLSETAGKE